jgi:hypothetical protein
MNDSPVDSAHSGDESQMPALMDTARTASLPASDTRPPKKESRLRWQDAPLAVRLPYPKNLSLVAHPRWTRSWRRVDLKATALHELQNSYELSDPVEIDRSEAKWTLPVA